MKYGVMLMLAMNIGGNVHCASDDKKNSDAQDGLDHKHVMLLPAVSMLLPIKEEREPSRERKVSESERSDSAPTDNDVLRRVCLRNGMTARCALDAYCWAQPHEVEQKRDECRQFFGQIKDKKTLTLFTRAFDDTNKKVIQRLLHMNATVLEQLAELAKASELSKEDAALVRSILQRQLRDANQRLKKKKCCFWCRD